jgi:hypothetical protein
MVRPRVARGVRRGLDLLQPTLTMIAYQLPLATALPALGAQLRMLKAQILEHDLASV